MAYTDAQIKAVCDKATDVLHGLTDAQNVTFPTTAVISGMKAGLNADTIANNARDAIEGLPMFNNGTYNTVGSNLNLFNLCSYMRGVIYNEIKALEGNTPTPTPTEEPTPTPTPTEEEPTLTPTEEPTPEPNTEEPEPPTPTE